MRVGEGDKTREKANIWPLEMQGKTPLVSVTWHLPGLAVSRYSSSTLNVASLTSPHRIIGQIPRFEVEMKSQKRETCFDHDRFADSSCAWLAFKPLP
jgi:hypothetical protein